MKQHKISWLNVPGYTPQTWNPIVGCWKISEGCKNCYAERQAIRNYNCLTSDRASSPSALDTYEAYTCALAFDKSPYEHRTFGLNEAQWSGFTAINESALDKPLKWKKPRAIFVNSMGDLFHESTDINWIMDVLDVVERCPQHLFIILTKRAKRMHSIMQHSCYDRNVQQVLKNVWLGVTAENQKAADERIPHLLRTPSAVRFVSCEPMVGGVEFDDDWMRRICFECRSADWGKPRNGPAQCFEPIGIDGLACGCLRSTGIDWVICGGESGPGARAMDPAWARSLRDQCKEAGVPFFFKQWGDAKLSHREHQAAYAAGYSREERHGGDHLDGVQWHEWPEVEG